MIITAKQWGAATRKQCRQWLKCVGASARFDTQTWNSLPEDVRALLLEGRAA